MKVLILTNRFNVGGISKVVGIFASGLQQRGFNVYLYGGNIEPGEKFDEDYFKSLNVKITLLKQMHRSINPLYDLIAIIKLFSILLEIRPDVLFTHASKAGFVGRIASLFYPFPLRIVHQYHGSVFEHYFNKFQSKTYIFVEKMLNYITDDIIVVSAKVHNDIVNRYRIAEASKVNIIELGINDRKYYPTNYSTLFRNKYKIELDTKILLIVGRLVPIKNHPLFIDIIADLKKKGSNKILGIIVGDGEILDYLMKYCTTLNLDISFKDYKNTDIWFTSWRHDLPDFYNASDLVLMTSLNEGFPVSLLEGMSCRKVVISSNVGGVSDLIEHGVDGFFCENSVDEFSKIIQTLLSDQEMCSKIGISARSKIVLKYTENIMIERFISILNN